MKFIEWILRLPRRFMGCSDCMEMLVMTWFLFLIFTFLWFLLYGPQILALIPLIVSMYTFYRIEEKGRR